MATNSTQKSLLASQSEDDDSTQDFDTIPPLKNPGCSSSQQRRQPQLQFLKPFNSAVHRRPSKRAKSSVVAAGKENLALASPFLSKAGILNFEPLPTQFNSTNPLCADPTAEMGCSIASNIPLDDCCLASTESTSDCGCRDLSGCKHLRSTPVSVGSASVEVLEGKGLDPNQRGGYSANSVESRLLMSIVNPGTHDSVNQSGFEDDGKFDESEPCTQLDVLLKLCSNVDEQDGKFDGAEFSHHQEGGFNTSPIHCPLCGADIMHLTDELRQVHTNDCLDKEETRNVKIQFPNGDVQPLCPGQVLDGSPIKSPRQIDGFSPVLEWLHSLGLARYQKIFVQEEIDWDTLQWLTEEDLFGIGITALGPRKRIFHALSELRKGSTKSPEIRIDSTKNTIDETGRLAANKLITDYFPGPAGHRKKDCTSSSGQPGAEKGHSDTRRKQIVVKKNVKSKTLRDIPQWCNVPGTPFRVDAFKYLRRDCSHWFLTHFHMDHYQGLTRSFSHGKIYCSVITARLVNMKIGIPWDKLQVLPLNQKISISGIDVTCFDANHCPGSIILLFEPPNGKAVLHTGDFRFCEEMKKIHVLQCVQTLILDTTYCNPQYDFPKQEAVIQFVIEAIQAEAFNPKTLFLIGSYTIGKERLFLEVARVLRKKVYVTAAKLRLLECLGLPVEDMQWLTLNEQESHIHVVPMWTLASFKRLKCISSQYANRFSLIIAFSPTGWTFGKGKKSSGRRYQQGTIVRYEVPYSEHCSFTELKEFVKFISPVNIIPSVNNNGLEAANAMVSLLVS